MGVQFKNVLDSYNCNSDITLRELELSGAAAAALRAGDKT